MICKVEDLINIVKNEYKNGSFSYDNIEITKNEDGLCFSTLLTQNGETVTFTIPIYNPLKFISSLINGTKIITDHTLIMYPFSVKLYPYIKSLWENYTAEINYYN